MMQGITIVHYPGQRSQAMGLNDNKRKIIGLFGIETLTVYGLND